MLKRTVTALLMTLPLAAPAFAQSTPAATPSQPVMAAQPASDSSVDACVAQMHKMAQMNKGLGANWNVDRVRRDCAAGVYGR